MTARSSASTCVRPSGARALAHLGTAGRPRRADRVLRRPVPAGRVDEGDALGDHPARPAGARRRRPGCLVPSSRRRSLRAKSRAIRARVDARRQRGQLVDDGLRLGLRDRALSPPPRPARRTRPARPPPRAAPRRPRRRAGHARHLVARRRSAAAPAGGPITPVAPARKTLMRRRRPVATGRPAPGGGARSARPSGRAHTMPSLKPAEPMPKAPLKRERRFSTATRLTSSTSCASSKRSRRAAISSSVTCVGVRSSPPRGRARGARCRRSARSRGSGGGRAAARR